MSLQRAMPDDMGKFGLVWLAVCALGVIAPAIAGDQRKSKMPETGTGPCVPPAEKRIDFRGNVDACVAGQIVGELVCLDPATQMENRVGEDRCVKVRHIQ